MGKWGISWETHGKMEDLMGNSLMTWQNTCQSCMQGITTLPWRWRGIPTLFRSIESPVRFTGSGWETLIEAPIGSPFEFFVWEYEYPMLPFALLAWLIVDSWASQHGFQWVAHPSMAASDSKCEWILKDPVSRSLYVSLVCQNWVLQYL